MLHEISLVMLQADLEGARTNGSAPSSVRFMDEQLIVHGEPFTEHKSTFQVLLSQPQQPSACTASLFSTSSHSMTITLLMLVRVT